MRTALAASGFALFFLGLALNVWISGVILETKVASGIYYIRLRGHQEEWILANWLVFWGHFLVKYAMMAVCMLAMFWALFRWLWGGRPSGE